MTNRQKNLDSWTPAKLAEALARLDEDDRALVADLEEAEATRIAKGWERVKVWWVNQGLGVLCDGTEHQVGHPCIITPDSIVGETPDKRLMSMRLILDQMQRRVADGAVELATMTNDLRDEVNERIKVNAAIAAARKEGE